VQAACTDSHKRDDIKCENVRLSPADVIACTGKGKACLNMGSWLMVSAMVGLTKKPQKEEVKFGHTLQ
jgi:hypothetical protein